MPATNRPKEAIAYPGGVVISAAQNWEDVLLNRAFEGRPHGFYIDVGAGDPNWDSVTNWFYRLGWRGINVEPNPDIFAILQEWRPEDVNLNVGASAQRDELEYTQVLASPEGAGWGLSGFGDTIAGRAAALGLGTRRMRVPVVPLDEIVAAHVPDGGRVDLLKIDNEGHEIPTLHGLDLKRTRPRVLCIEAVEPNSSRMALDDLLEVLEPVGYELAVFDGVNAYFVAEEEPRLFNQLSAPVNCSDRWRKAQAEDFVKP